jgi:hypothetical protein
MASSLTLVVGLLSVQSSYAKEVEQPATGVPDTIQFWLTSDTQRRIRTYAMDHDIHVYSLGSIEENKVSVEFAIEHIKKHYADVTASLIVLMFSDPKDKKEVEQLLAARHLKGTLEISNSGVAFYNPDGGEYQTKSKPK